MKPMTQSSDASALLSSIEDIIADVKAGKPVIIVDDENRENEGDLIIAAQCATADNINFMARFGRGLICLPMESVMVDRLGLELMGRGNSSRHKTAFTVSIEAREGITTGISAADRAKTIQVAVDPKTGPQDIATPGHIFPLKARDGGVLVRAGHTEAAVDLSRLAGFSGAGVICEIMNEDGTMARLNDLSSFAATHGLKIGSIEALIAYRRRREKMVERVSVSEFTTRYGGKFMCYIYRNTVNDTEHVALIKGQIDPAKPVWVRMHAMNVMKDALGGGDGTLEMSMNMIADEGQGVVVLIREPSAQVVMTDAPSTPPSALRDYGVGAQILLDLGVKKMVLLTNSPKNVVGLDGYDLHILSHKAIS